jgi:hypothetical protein
MADLTVILVNDNIIRATLAELAERTTAEYWLLASPHYLDRLGERHRALFRRILVQDDFDANALIGRLEPELGGRRPESLKFLTNDESCELACAELQERFGAPLWPTEQVLPFVNKLASKARLAGTGVRLPRHVLFDRERFAAAGREYCAGVVEEVGLPLVVKPIDRYASMDVRRLDTLAELRAWASWASSPKDRNTYEIDEFIDGTIYNCDSFVQDGQVVWTAVCRNINPCLDFAAGRSIGVYTLPTDDPVAVRVREFSATVLAALRPPDGAVHLELFLTPSDELVFLEVAARPPGGDARGIYQRCAGFDIDLAHFLLRARAQYELTAHDTGWYGAWLIHPRPQGTITAVEAPPLRSEHTLTLSVAVGDVVERASQHIVDRPAAEFLVFNDDFAVFERDMDLIRELTLCQVQR